jgi:hypothetical protein
MATTNPVAAKKTMKSLTNQKTLTSIFKKVHTIDKLYDEDESIDLSNAILENPAGKELVDYLVEGKRPHDGNVASLLASLLTAARLS